MSAISEIKPEIATQEFFFMPFSSWKAYSTYWENNYISLRRCQVIVYSPYTTYDEFYVYNYEPEVS